MKRAAVASAALLAVATLLTGCQKEEVEKLVAPQMSRKPLKQPKWKKKKAR